MKIVKGCTELIITNVVLLHYRGTSISAWVMSKKNLALIKIALPIQGPILLYTHQNWPKNSTIARNILKKNSTIQEHYYSHYCKEPSLLYCYFPKTGNSILYCYFYKPKSIITTITTYSIQLEQFLLGTISGSKCVIARASH